MNKRILFLITVGFVLLFALTACSTAVEKGSILICPKYYEPGISVCREKTDTSMVPGEGEQEMKAVFLQADEIGVYKDGAETYSVYQGMGFHPTPADFVRVYKRGTQRLMSDMSCQPEDETKCIGVMGNVTLKDQAKFSASYSIDYSLNYASQEDLRELFEVGGVLQLMSEFNDYTRDTFRNSRDLDPKAWLEGTLTYDGVAANWFAKLQADEHMTSWKYFNLFTFEGVSVRYFEPDTEKEAETTSSQVTEDMEFERYLVRRDAFCSAYPEGGSYRLECERTFVCSEKDGACYFGGSVIPIEDLPTEVPPADAAPATNP